jgi:hypothetical protein
MLTGKVVFYMQKILKVDTYSDTLNYKYAETRINTTFQQAVRIPSSLQKSNSAIRNLFLMQVITYQPHCFIRRFPGLPLKPIAFTY